MTSLLQSEPKKICSTCKQEKEVAANFHKNKNYRGGYTAQCKACRLTAIKAWRKANPEKVQAARKRFYATEKGKAVWKRHRLKYPEQRKAILERWRADNPERIKFHALNRRLKKFGMSHEEYEALVKEQNNLCAICSQPEARGEDLAIDHSHVTGKNRGLLCEKHNLMLGLAGDSPEILRKAAEYLERYASKAA